MALLALLSLTVAGQWLYRTTRAPLTQHTPSPDSLASRTRSSKKWRNPKPVEINRADSTAFEQLPHIGPVTARRIIRYRQKVGGFRSLSHFKQVWGMDTLYPHIAQYVYLDSTRLPARQAQKAPTADAQRLQPTQQALHKRAYTPIDINEADSSALEALPMIGPTLARRIVQYRAKLGFYHSPTQLKEVYGMQDSNYTVFAPYLYVTTETLASYPQVYINESAEATLARHPYIGFSLARRIVRYREQHGAYRSSADLEKMQAITPGTWQRLAPYLNFR